MPSKEQLIREILHDNVSRTPEEHDAYNRALWAAPVEHLQLVANKKRAIAELAQSEAAYQQHRAEREADRVIQSIRAQEAARPKIEAQSRVDYAEFLAAAKEFRLWSTSHASFDILLRHCGSPFDKYAAQAAVLAGQVTVSRPTPAEIQAWDEEAREQRIDFLTNHASPEQLRAAAAQETADARRTAQQQNIEYQLVLEYERDKRNNPYLQPLPANITAQDIKACGADQLRRWIRVAGNAQVTARMHGIKRASATLDRGTGRGPEVVSYTFD
jgi:hypothetical protein